jgi:hypothetical protein
MRTIVYFNDQGAKQVPALPTGQQLKLVGLVRDF